MSSNNIDYVYKCKSAESSEVMAQDDDMELINSYSRKALEPKDVYIFTVALCNNDLDRDCERFSLDSLEELQKLFVGKPGIFDHSMKGKDQTARIFKTWIEKGDKECFDGTDFYSLKGKAYIPRTDKNADLITEIESGIKKEVSVGCSVEAITCSICGANMAKGECSHVKGKAYDGKLCYGILSKPNDAYEWSFVAVPSQREAGVTKSCKTKSSSFDNNSDIKGGATFDMVDRILNGVNKNAEIVTLSKNEFEEVSLCIKSLQKDAKYGLEYKEILENETFDLLKEANKDTPDGVIRGLVAKLGIKELKVFKSSLETHGAKIFPMTPQLVSTPKKGNEGTKDYKI